MIPSCDLFTALSLQDLSDQAKLAYLQQIHQIVMARLIQEDFPKYLPKSQMDELAKLADKPNEMENFLRVKVPNLDELITRQTLKLKEKLLAEWQNA